MASTGEKQKKIINGNFSFQVGYNPDILYFIGTLAAALLYFPIGALFAYFDLSESPDHWLRRYKIQQGDNQPVQVNAKFQKMIRRVYLNGMLVTAACTAGFVYLMHLRGFPDVRVLPSIFVLVRDVSVTTVLAEILFFYGHWLLHQRPVRIFTYLIVSCVLKCYLS